MGAIVRPEVLAKPAPGAETDWDAIGDSQVAAAARRNIREERVAAAFEVLRLIRNLLYFNRGKGSSQPVLIRRIGDVMAAAEKTGVIDPLQ